MYKYISIVALSLAISPFSLMQAAYADEQYEVEITDDGISTNALDFFAYSELLPGEIRKGSAQIINSSSKAQRVSFLATLTGNEDVSETLMSTAKLTVMNSGEDIYSGPLKGAGAPVGGVDLCSISPEESAEMSWELEIPQDADEGISEAYGEVMWGWNTTEIVVGDLVKAGDSLFFVFVLLSALVAISGIYFALYKQKQHEKEFVIPKRRSEQ